MLQVAAAGIEGEEGEEEEECDNYINHTNGFCGQNGKLINVKTCGIFCYHSSLKGF
jgi:hypothetical protein